MGMLAYISICSSATNKRNVPVTTVVLLRNSNSKRFLFSCSIYNALLFTIMQKM